MKHLKIKINSLEFNGEIILKDIDLTLNKSDKISIVGSNGAGKTTLMKILTGEITAYDGNIDNVGNLTLGYLHQIYSDDENKLVKQELKEGMKDIVEMEKQLDIVEEKMNKEPNNIQIIEEYTSLLEQFNNIGGHDYNNRIHNVANGIGILELLDRKLSEVSGGQRTKIALAKVLLESPDILFLDEPTNFIDMTSVEWLESFLQNKWKGGYVIISHDREFLDKTCNKTYEVQPKRGLTFYHTNYSGYLVERDRTEKKKIENYKREQEFIEKEEKLINRFRAGSRAGWAKSREKSLDKMEKLEPPYIPRKPKFFFDFSGDLPEKVLSFKEVFIGRKEPLFFINELYLYRKQRIGIVGENGVGKSTFLKTIMREIEVLDGFYSRGKAVKVGYYSQMHEELDKNKTVRENFEKHGFSYPDQHLIGLLSHYLFEKADLDKKVSDLSGGQTSKLLFAILGQKECNLLILDEPTNHLDYDTRESLEESLKDFPGSLLFISHDRYFVNKLATNIWFIDNSELSISYGNYEDYRFKLEHNIEMDINIFDEAAELSLVLEEKLGEREFKRLKDKFARGKDKRRQKHRK
ncbi:MAG: ABC-F family ATP-binding cassette domain-containing protein [Candidatus Gracilibacteria bacterium]|nr:ABC-F family ATP-binding cassette domain-containing protein [Candidatus Gracilibacteria bacterium]